MDFTDILKEVNLLSYAGAFVKWSLIGLLTGIGLVVLGYCLKFFRRRTKVARYLMILYYVFIPVFLIVIGFKIAPIRNTQKQLNLVIEEHRQEIVEYTTVFYLFLEEATGEFDLSGLSAEEGVDMLVVKYIEQETAQQSDNNKLVKKVLNKATNKIRESFLSMMARRFIANKTSDYLGVDKKVINQAYRVNINALLVEGEIIDMLKRQVNLFFRHIYISTLIVVLIVLMVPVLEYILSWFLNY